MKLWWTNRKVKRHEIADVEKRRQIEEIRRSGILIRSRPNSNAPFGIRAIENGIEIDGVWISRPNTPLASGLEANSRSQSAGSSVVSTSGDTTGTNISNTSPQHVFHNGSFPSKFPHSNTLPTIRVGREPILSSSPTDYTIRRSNFKPKRSSHLRFSSLGEAPSHETNPEIHERSTDSPIHSRQSNYTTDVVETVQDSINIPTIGYVASEVERVSGQHTRSLSEPLRPPRPASSMSNHAYQRLMRSEQSSNVETISKTVDRVPEKKTIGPKDYNNVPLLRIPTPLIMEHHDCIDELDISGELHQSLLSSERTLMCPSPSPSNNVHINKSVRKINPGFELLPAGTFGNPSRDLVKAPHEGFPANYAKRGGGKSFWGKFSRKGKKSTPLIEVSKYVDRSS